MHERRCVIIKFHNVQQLNMISNASVHVRHASSLVDKMHIFDRFFGVHCNECKEVITDRVMKAGDRVRSGVCHWMYGSLHFLTPGLPRRLLQVLRLYGEAGAR